MKRSSKILVFGVVVIVAGAAWVLRDRNGRTGPAVSTAQVDRGEVVANVTTTGTLTAVTTVKVGSQVSGIIATLHADFNDRVARGQVLATLDPTPFETQVNQNRAQIQRARIATLDAEARLRRSQALFEAQLISEDQLDSVRAIYQQNLAQVEELDAALERAQTNLSYSVIRSPIDGVVVSRDYDVGQTVAASFQAPTLFTIAEDLRRMQLTCDVDEADIGQISMDQPVRFRVDTFPEREFSGTVAQIRLSPSTASNVVTYPVIVNVDNSDLTLLPGMTAEVRVEVARAEQALRVPASALRFRPEMVGLSAEAPSPAGEHEGAGNSRPAGPRRGGPGRGSTVFLPAERAGQPLRAVFVTTGLTDGQFIEITGGELREGTEVVVGLATARSAETSLPGMGGGFGPPRRR